MSGQEAAPGKEGLLGVRSGINTKQTVVGEHKLAIFLATRLK